MGEIKWAFNPKNQWFRLVGDQIARDKRWGFGWVNWETVGGDQIAREKHMYSFMGWGKEKREGENIEDGETKTGWWERTREIKGKQIIKKLII